jgi:hypothetical protein
MYGDRMPCDRRDDSRLRSRADADFESRHHDGDDDVVVDTDRLVQRFRNERAAQHRLRRGVISVHVLAAAGTKSGVDAKQQIADGHNAMTAALLPAIAGALNELPLGACTKIQTSEGHIDAFLAYAGCNRSIGTATYALRILNRTSAPTSARLFVEQRGTALRAYPIDIEVAPYSMRDDFLPVRIDVTGPYDRAILRVSNALASFTVEAPPPPRRRKRWLPYAGAFAAALALASGTSLARPQVLALDAPAKGYAGQPLHVLYQTSGLGRVRYQFSTRDGVQLSAGFAAGSGTLNLPMPAAAGASYVLHLRIQNAMLADERSAQIAAVPAIAARHAAPRSAAPAIADLAVSPSAVSAGGTVAVTYAAQADSGNVMLVDAYGRTWASSPLTPAGVSSLSVPLAAAGRDMRVVIDAQRNNAHAQSSIALAVLAGDRPVVAVKPDEVPHPQSSARIDLSSTVVAPGDSVGVRVSGVQGDVAVVVRGASGNVVAQGNAGGDAGSLAITAPAVTQVQTFYISATYTDGSGQQTLVRRFVVTPR